MIVNQALHRSTIMAQLQPNQNSIACGFQSVLFQAAGAQVTLTFFFYIALGAGLGVIAGTLQQQIRQQALWR